MGIPGADADLPTEAEVRFFKTRFRKFFFVLNHVFFYSIRPMIVRPKVLSSLEI